MRPKQKLRLSVFSFTLQIFLRLSSMALIGPFLDHSLSNHTSFFGLKLWVFLLICVAASLLLLLPLLCLYFLYCRRLKPISSCFTALSPAPFKNSLCNSSSLDRRLLSSRILKVELGTRTPGMRPVLSGQWASSGGFAELGAAAGFSGDVKVTKQCYNLGEIEVATNSFASENVIGCGENGIVYRGVLLDGTRAAIKKLHYSGKPENFVANVEAIAYARHKNLVQLLGYCSEEHCRMIVYEYVDNGSLYQWLHGCKREVSPLTWKIRMNIIQAAAKGLAYLHEDIEPKVIHQHVKSSNILLDHQWNPKLSDIGIAKILGPEWSCFATSAMGMSGYTAPEFAYAGVFNEKTDVYSFGILLMEIVTGRTPVNYSTENKAEVYLVDWIKSMVAQQKYDVMDPNMPDMPSLKELKRVILIALRCVDPDAKSRPRMGDLIHMFEPLDLLLSDGGGIRHKTCRRDSSNENLGAIVQHGENAD